MIIGVMSASSLVLFLHPLDEVFYPGMVIIFLQNHFWVLLMVKPEDQLAILLHPYLHSSNSGDWKFSNTRQSKQYSV
jgi:hypothetical protein